MRALAAAKTMPATTGMQTTGWTISSNVGVAIFPFTRQQQKQEWGGEMRKVKVTFPPMLRVKAAAWLGFFASPHGRAKIFMLGPTGMARTQGVATGAIANSLHSVGERSLSLRTAGWTPNVNGILLNRARNIHEEIFDCADVAGPPQSAMAQHLLPPFGCAIRRKHRSDEVITKT